MRPVRAAAPLLAAAIAAVLLLHQAPGAHAQQAQLAPVLDLPYARGAPIWLTRMGSPFATTRCMAASMVAKRSGGAALVINFEYGGEWGVVDLDAAMAPGTPAWPPRMVNVSWLPGYRSAGYGLAVLTENQARADNGRYFMLTKAASVASSSTNSSVSMAGSAGVVVWDPATESLRAISMTPPGEDGLMYQLAFANPNATEAARWGRKVYIGSNSKGLRGCYVAELDIDTLAWRTPVAGSGGRLGTDRQSYSYCYEMSVAWCVRYHASPGLLCDARAPVSTLVRAHVVASPPSSHPARPPSRRAGLGCTSRWGKTRGSWPR